MWPSMSKDIKLFVSPCLICQQAKASNTATVDLLQPLPIPSQIWEVVSMDTITGLPLSNGFTVFMAVVDKLSRYSYSAPLKADFTSPKVVESFLHHIVKIHGFPRSLVSDLKLLLHWQHFVFIRQNQKLALRYFGPFPITEKIGTVAYTVLPPPAKIHPVFHIVYLKLCKGAQYFPLPLLTSDTGPILILDIILDSRVLLQHGKEVSQVLVQWLHLPASEATCENWTKFSANYPNLNLEDNANFNGGSNVMWGHRGRWNNKFT